MATTVNLTYNNTVVAPSGGTNPFAGTGQDYRFTLSQIGTGSEVTIVLTDAGSGFQTQVGFGNVTGAVPVFMETFNNQVYALAGAFVYFSAVNGPTVWDDPNGTGDSFLELGNYFGTPEPLIAMSPYQGKLAFFSRWTTQIWITNADPTQWFLLQILQNIGVVTGAGLTVQPLGDLDVLFLADSGIRSLRVRDSSLNAFVNDMGSPIDTLIQASLLGGATGACGIVEPSTGRYWCYLNGVIYVLSYYPSNKIVAWSTYLPTTQTAMIPSAFTYPSGLTVTYTVVIGRKYYWIKGATDIALTDGTTNLSASGYIVPVGTTLTMHGASNGAPVNATLYEATPFVPQKFVVYQGQVYTRDAVQGYVYGGSTNNVYDYSQGIAALTWIDLGKSAKKKFAKGLDSAFNGAFQFLFSMNYLGGNTSLQSVYNSTTVTFQKGQIPLTGSGFHFKMQAQTNDNNPATLSSFVFEFQQADEK